MNFSYHFEFHQGKFNFSQCILIAKGILFLFPALIRSNSAERKAHDTDIILKIELYTTLKNLSINPSQINVPFLYMFLFLYKQLHFQV